MSVHAETTEIFMRMALEQARKAAAAGEVPVGAVVVGRAGNVLAAAHNAPLGLNDPAGHAEILALREAALAAGNYRLPGSVLYVTLEPCIMCFGAMVHARVATLVFGTPDLKSGVVGGVVDLTRAAFLNHSVEVVGGVLAEESAKLLRDFFRERRRAR